MLHRNIALVLLVNAFLTAPLSVWAQDAARATREREVLRHAQQQIQKATQELAVLQQKATAAEGERAALAQDLEQTKAKGKADAGARQKLQLGVQTLTAERDEMKTKLEAKTAEAQALTAKISSLELEVATTAKQSQQLLTQASERQTKLMSRAEVCEQSNAKLYATGRELVDQCRDRSASDLILRLEPFTGLGRVGVENRLEGVRDQLDSAKIPASPR